MRLPDRLRTTQRLGDLLIDTPRGWIPARQVADIKETEGPNQILRENGRRRIVVLANTDGTADMARIVQAIRGELRAIQLPEGFFTGLSYIRDRSGAFLIREVWQGSDGQTRYIILPEEET